MYMRMVFILTMLINIANCTNQPPTPMNNDKSTSDNTDISVPSPPDGVQSVENYDNSGTTGVLVPIGGMEIVATKQMPDVPSASERLVTGHLLREASPVPGTVVFVDQDGIFTDIAVDQDGGFAAPLQVGLIYGGFFLGNKDNILIPMEITISNHQRSNIFYLSEVVAEPVYLLSTTKPAPLIDLGEITITDGIVELGSNLLCHLDNDGDLLPDCADIDSDDDGIDDFLDGQIALPLSFDFSGVMTSRNDWEAAISLLCLNAWQDLTLSTTQHPPLLHLRNVGDAYWTFMVENLDTSGISVFKAMQDASSDGTYNVVVSVTNARGEVVQLETQVSGDIITVFSNTTNNNATLDGPFVITITVDGVVVVTRTVNSIDTKEHIETILRNAILHAIGVLEGGNTQTNSNQNDVTNDIQYSNDILAISPLSMKPTFGEEMTFAEFEQRSTMRRFFVTISNIVEVSESPAVVMTINAKIYHASLASNGNRIEFGFSDSDTKEIETALINAGGKLQADLDISVIKGVVTTLHGYFFIIDGVYQQHQQQILKDHVMVKTLVNIDVSDAISEDLISQLAHDIKKKLHEIGYDIDLDRIIAVLNGMHCTHYPLQKLKDKGYDPTKLGEMFAEFWQNTCAQNYIPNQQFGDCATFNHLNEAQKSAAKKYAPEQYAEVDERCKADGDHNNVPLDHDFDASDDNGFKLGDGKITAAACQQFLELTLVQKTMMKESYPDHYAELITQCTTVNDHGQQNDDQTTDIPQLCDDWNALSPAQREQLKNEHPDRYNQYKDSCAPHTEDPEHDPVPEGNNTTNGDNSAYQEICAEYATATEQQLAYAKTHYPEKYNLWLEHCQQ